MRAAFIAIVTALSVSFVRKNTCLTIFKPWERIALFAGGLILVSPYNLLGLAGLALLGIVLLAQSRREADTRRISHAQREI
ncbi:hypothetical protein [Ferviditalea candida]|uniref:Uncharacterized protein n=1 Tax=Ferviditalea candida TaxID=3108399 RepID=A0ABU5ZJ00_9BACL|nr:hypothetical protein [Paenibacillaceae bacterium T2]